jgi:hypothetical protein
MEKLVEDKFHKSYTSPNNIRVKKLRMKLVEHVQYEEDMKISCKILPENLRGKAWA